MKIFYTHEFLNMKSHDLLTIAIAEYIGDAKRAVELANSMKVMETSRGFGKPYIEDFGSFSISHSDNSWAVLICDKPEKIGACGLDIQYLRECNEVSIANRFYSTQDAAAVRDADYEERSVLFFKIWARREALIKCAGSSVADSKVPAVLNDDIVQYKGRTWQLLDVEIPGAHELAAAICVENGIDNVEYIKLEI